MSVFTDQERAIALAEWTARVEHHVAAEDVAILGEPDSIAVDLVADIVSVITERGAVVMASREVVSVAVELGSVASWTHWKEQLSIGTDVDDSMSNTIGSKRLNP